MSNARIKVTVYITSRNYGRFLCEAVDSILRQSISSWELLIFDDGSSDDTASIANKYVQEHPNKIVLHRNPKPCGLRACANKAIEAARGEYVIRLDADDYFDDNALLVLSRFLDEHQDIGLVYPNWVYVDEDGGYLGLENRKRIGTEDKVLDLPAHGACTMVRKRVLKSIGGYDEKFDSQDGHELWLKVLHRFNVGNVSTPLFFYRQHGNSMSRDQRRLLSARQKIKRDLALKQNGKIKPRIVAIVPAKNTYANMPNVALNPLAGKPLIDYTLDAAERANLFENIYVTTDDPNVVAHCGTRDSVIAELRPDALSSTRTKLTDVLLHSIDQLENEQGVFPDIVTLLSIHSPLRRSEHIVKAIDTLTLYNVDNVISTYEDVDLHFAHGRDGLETINKGMLNTLRFEREALYVDNGAIHTFWREYATETNMYQGRVGHIVMCKEDSSQIKHANDIPMIELQLQQRDCI